MEEELDEIIDDSLIDDFVPDVPSCPDDDYMKQVYEPTDEGSDESKSKEIPFGGHTSGKCNLCGCTHFRPSSNEKYCLCGHSDYDHEWI